MPLRRFLLLILLLLPGLVRAQGSGRFDGAVARSRAAVDSVRAAARIPGVSVTVLKDGEIVWSEGFGLADVELGAPVTTETRFRTGSVSKVVATAALARLYEAGRVELDAPVQRYVPSFPEKRWPVTTRQLTGHLAGIRHYRDEGEMLIRDRYPTVEASLDVFRDDTLLFEPGTRASYSTHAWTLVGAVVEAAAGTDFLSAVRREVLQPLGLRSLRAEHMDSLIHHRTAYYQLDSLGRLVNAPYVDNSWKWAGGGYVSNTQDLARFGWAHLADGYLRPETRRLLFTEQRLRSGEPAGTGIGWRMGRSDLMGGRAYVGHSGGSVGGTAMLVLLPEEGLVVAVLSNLTTAPSGQIAFRVADAFLEE